MAQYLCPMCHQAHAQGAPCVPSQRTVNLQYPQYSPAQQQGGNSFPATLTQSSYPQPPNVPPPAVSTVLPAAQQQGLGLPLAPQLQGQYPPPQTSYQSNFAGQYAPAPQPAPAAYQPPSTYLLYPCSPPQGPQGATIHNGPLQSPATQHPSCGSYAPPEYHLPNAHDWFRNQVGELLNASPTDPAVNQVTIAQALATAQREYPELVEMLLGAIQLLIRQPGNFQAAELVCRGLELVYRKAEDALRVQGQEYSATVQQSQPIRRDGPQNYQPPSPQLEWRTGGPARAPLIGAQSAPMRASTSSMYRESYRERDRNERPITSNQNESVDRYQIPARRRME